MNAISKLRFDSLAGYSRDPMTPLLVEEEGWFEDANEKVLGMLGFHPQDNDYVIYVLGRDAKGRFRAVWVDCSIVSASEAYVKLETSMSEHARMDPVEFYQNDEISEQLDFFTPVVPDDNLNPSFRHLAQGRANSPVRSLISEMMHYFEDVDGNFVQQFQTTGFDARLWELYLYALFTELGYGFDRSEAVPDFACVGLMGAFFVEATTVNRSGGTPTPEHSPEYFENYVPLKFGSALFSKLNKQYWNLPPVGGFPFIIAIQDFHAPQAMFWSNSALVEYLYGIRQTEKKKPDGTSETVSEPVEFYLKDGKQIPAGFFLQPDTENISAVLANPGGTISKFNRMGFLAGFGDRDILMTRWGLCYRDSVTAERFVADVNSPDYAETWVEGVSVYHNERAIVPLDIDTMPGAAHHTRRGDRIMSRLPPFYPVGSMTNVVVPQA
jgi:hypothetical protein